MTAILPFLFLATNYNRFYSFSFFLCFIYISIICFYDCYFTFFIFGNKL